MTEMRTTVFTPTQIHLLKMFQYMKTEEDLESKDTFPTVAIINLKEFLKLIQQK